MQTLSNYKLLAFAALFFWLITGLNGAHGHFCFDGQEPPVSLHLGVASDHQEHVHEDLHEQSALQQQHMDMDVDFSQNLVIKFFKFDLPILLLAALVLLICLLPVRVSVTYQLIILRRFFTFHPPLRAPPYIPA